MAGTSSFSFNLAIGVLPELDEKKDPSIYRECVRLRSAIRVLAEALDSYTGAGSLVNAQYLAGRIPYGSGAGLVTSSNFTYDQSTNTVSFGKLVGNELSLSIKPKIPTGSEVAGSLNLTGSAAVLANGNGGSINLTAGAKNGTGVSGSVALKTASNLSGVEVTDTAGATKVGFWGVTPVVRATTAIAGSAIVGGVGTTVKEDTTFDGYTLAKVVAALKTAGILT